MGNLYRNLDIILSQRKKFTGVMVPQEKYFLYSSWYGNLVKLQNRWQIIRLKAITAFNFQNRLKFFKFISKIHIENLRIMLKYLYFSNPKNMRTRFSHTSKVTTKIYAAAKNHFCWLKHFLFRFQRSVNMLIVTIICKKNISLNPLNH